MADYIPTRTDAEQLLLNLADTDSILRMATLKAIWTAMVAATVPTISGAGPTTGSISKGSATGQQVEKLYEELRSKGLTVTNGSTTFTVTL